MNQLEHAYHQHFTNPHAKSIVHTMIAAGGRMEDCMVANPRDSFISRVDHNAIICPIPPIQPPGHILSGGGGGGGEGQSPLEANQECDLAPPYFKLQNNIICKIRRWDGSCWVLTLVSSRQTFIPLGHSSHFFSFAFFYIHSVSSIWIFSAWHAFPVSCLVALFFTHVCMLYTYSWLLRSKPLSLLPHRVQATRAVCIMFFFFGCNLFFPRGELSNPFFCCVQPTILLVKLYTRRERIR